MGHMKQYKQLLNELPSKTVVFAFGRFNPPTTGHELLMKAVQRVAQQKRADHVVFASKTQNAKKDPLPVDKKVKYLQQMFPRMNFRAADQEVRTFIEAAAKLSKMGYKNVIMVAGSDRVAEFTRLLNQYNGKDFNFETVAVISAGQRDPDSDNATGMSGTKMRAYATKGDFEKFKKGLPTTMREIDARRLMNDIRMGMNMPAIREEINLVKDTLRERYFRGEIFNVGDMVTEDNKVYEVTKRGSNHLLVRDMDGNLVSKWIQDVKEVEMNESKEKGLTDKTVRKTDRIKVARMIAMMLGVDNPESGTPEALVNMGLRKVRVKALNPEALRLVNKILALAKSYEIKYDANLVPSKLKEEKLPSVKKVDTSKKNNIAGDILTPSDFRKLKKMSEDEKNESDFDTENKGNKTEVGTSLVADDKDNLRRQKVKYQTEDTSLPQQAARSQKKIAKAKQMADHESERLSLAKKHSREKEQLAKESTNKLPKLSQLMKNANEEKDDLEDACWKGYKAVGLKDKNGKKVPNCVPVKEETELQKVQRHLTDLAQLELDVKDADPQLLDHIAEKREELLAQQAELSEGKFKEDVSDYENDIQITDFSDSEIDDIVNDITDDEIFDEILADVEEDDIMVVDDEGNEVEDEEDELDEETKAKLDEVLTRAGRIKTKINLRKTKAKRQRGAKIALKRRSTTKVANKRARRLAIKALKKRFLQGRDPSKLSVSERERIERIIAKKKSVINRIALKMVPRVRKMENQRMGRK